MEPITISFSSMTKMFSYCTGNFYSHGQHHFTGEGRACLSESGVHTNISDYRLIPIDKNEMFRAELLGPEIRFSQCVMRREFSIDILAKHTKELYGAIQALEAKRTS